MTRREAITNLKMISVAFVDPVTKEQRKLIDDTFEMAIQALSQEPCDDAISRKDAEQMFRNIRGHLKPQDYKSAEEFNTRDLMLLNAEQMIHALPSVTQKSGKWIPVSERLPEAFRFVNCTCHSLIDDRKDWVVETCYIPQPSDSPYSDWGNIPMLNMGDCEVVAWMYRDIPKPYKVEPQESEE